MRCGLAAAPAILLALVLPHAAGAATICVGTQAGACEATAGNFQEALDQARNSPAADRVVLGTGLYEGPFDYVPSGGAIEVVGQGPSTVLTAPAAGAPDAVLDLASGGVDSGSTVSNLTVRIPANTNDTAYAGIRAQVANNVRVASDAHEVEVPSVPAPVGIEVAPGGAVRSSVIELVGGHGGIGVLARGAPGLPATTVSDSRILAPLGVEAAAQATSIVRSRIFPGALGVHACNAAVTVEDVLIRLSTSALVGVEAAGGEQCGQAQATLVVRQTTIVGSGAPAQTGAVASAGSPGQSPAVDISLSVLRDLGEATVASAQASGSASVRIGASDFEVARHLEVGPGSAGFEETSPDRDADPLFADPLLGDFSLAPGSPAIDSAFSPPLGPDESSTDLSGSPRVLDGDGDGVAARDMGAYEAPAGPDRRPPETRLARGKRRLRGRRHGVVFTADFSSSEAGSRFECKVDGGRFIACYSPFHKRLSFGHHRFEVRAVDAAGNADPSPAVASVAVQRIHPKHHRRQHPRHPGRPSGF